MTDRRNFLRGMVALSAAAVPVMTQAATLSDWDRLAVGLTIIHPRAPEALAHAQAAGMEPTQLITVLTGSEARPDSGRWPVVMFCDAENKFHTFRPRGRDAEDDDPAERDGDTISWEALPC